MPKANVAYVYRGDASVAQVIAKDGNGDWNTYDFRVNEPVPLPTAAGIERNPDFEKVNY